MEGKKLHSVQSLVLASSFLIFFCCCTSTEKEEHIKDSFFSWMAELEDPAVTLEFSWDSLMLNRDSEDEIGCRFTVYSAGTEYTLPAEISTRGVHRKAACDFPPLKLILEKDYVEAQPWSKPRKYKLVTKCMTGDNDHLYREHLIYKMLELHSDYALHSQLVPATFNYDDKIVEGHVILLENEEELARRLDFSIRDPSETAIKVINQEEYIKLVLFQYLIGNTDWNLTRGHNIKWLVKEDQSISPIPVAYDFDQCGLVDAPYAAPYPTLPIKSVRERFLQYRGDKDAPLLTATWQNILNKRDQVLKLIAENPHLQEETKGEMMRYLDEAYTKPLL